jgi:hypothetical protein
MHWPLHTVARGNRWFCAFVPSIIWEIAWKPTWRESSRFSSSLQWFCLRRSVQSLSSPSCSICSPSSSVLLESDWQLSRIQSEAFVIHHVTLVNWCAMQYCYCLFISSFRGWLISFITFCLSFTIEPRHMHFSTPLSARWWWHRPIVALPATHFQAMVWVLLSVLVSLLSWSSDAWRMAVIQSTDFRQICDSVLAYLAYRSVSMIFQCLKAQSVTVANLSQFDCYPRLSDVQNTSTSESRREIADPDSETDDFNRFVHRCFFCIDGVPLTAQQLSLFPWDGLRYNGPMQGERSQPLAQITYACMQGEHSQQSLIWTWQRGPELDDGESEYCDDQPDRQSALRVLQLVFVHFQKRLSWWRAGTGIGTGDGLSDDCTFETLAISNAVITAQFIIINWFRCRHWDPICSLR